VCAREFYTTIIYHQHAGEEQKQSPNYYTTSFSTFLFFIFLLQITKEVYIIPHEAIQQYEIKNTALN